MLTLLLLACTPKDSPAPDSGAPSVEDSPADTGPEDADGDGVIASQDCDDADPERWQALGPAFEGDVDVDNADRVCASYCARPVEGELWLEDPSPETLADLSCVTEVSGGLFIGCEDSERLDLSGLERLREVSGLLWLRCPGLQRLSGLEGLEQVGRLSVQADPALVDLSALSALRHVEGDLVLEDLGVTDLSALSNLAHVGGQLSLYGLERLETLSGLEGLRSGPTRLRLAEASALRSLDGFAANEALEHVTLDRLPALVDVDALAGLHLEYLQAHQVHALTELSGLAGLSAGTLILSDSDALASLEGPDYAAGGVLKIVSLPALRDLGALRGVTSLQELFIWDDDALTDLAGLEELEQVEAELRVERCEALSSLEGLDSLRGVESLYLQELPALRSLDGLSALESLHPGGLLALVALDRLESTQGLEGLTSSMSQLAIEGNPRLRDLSGLHHVGGLSWGVHAVDNPCLAPAEIDALIEAIGEENVGAGRTLEENNGPC